MYNINAFLKDGGLDIKKACTADLLPAKTNHVVLSS